MEKNQLRLDKKYPSRKLLALATSGYNIPMLASQLGVFDDNTDSK